MSAGTGPVCPRCGGEPVASIEVRGVYDGTLIWQCDGGHLWPRFPSGRLHAEATRMIADGFPPVDFSYRRPL